MRLSSMGLLVLAAFVSLSIPTTQALDARGDCIAMSGTSFAITPSECLRIMALSARGEGSGMVAEGRGDCVSAGTNMHISVTVSNCLNGLGALDEPEAQPPRGGGCVTASSGLHLSVQVENCIAHADQPSQLAGPGGNCVTVGSNLHVSVQVNNCGRTMTELYEP
jgi:hypothetical protein